MVPELRDEFESEGVHVRYFQGLFRQYRPGGFGAQRIVNLGWMLFSLPWVLVFRRPGKLLVRTTPPGIQIWAAFWMKILRIRGVLWLLDYHPEIEARRLERRGVFGRVAAKILRGLDRWSQNAFEKVIVPDGAMEETGRTNSGRENLTVFPTWLSSPVASVAQTDESSTGNQSVPSIRSSALAADATVRILYCGNLGSGHDLGGLEKWLESATQADDSQSERCIQIVTVGTGERGQDRFRELASRCKNFSWTHWGSLSDDELGKRIDEERVAWGLVLMDTSFKGLMSPSKFSTYLNLGLPILYFGPEGTNADRVCREFEAGKAFSGGGSLDEPMGKAVDERVAEECRDRVSKAREYFSAFDAKRFVEEVFGGEKGE